MANLSGRPGIAAQLADAVAVAVAVLGAPTSAALAAEVERPLWELGPFVRHDSLRGACFAATPLVRQTDNVALGIALSWVLASSSQRVTVTE